MMNIEEFAKALENKIKSSAPSAALKKEADFEDEHVIKPAWELAKIHPEITVCTHPSKSRETCKGNCRKEVLDFSSRVRGCPRCWSKSKEWSVVNAHGMQHNFDLVARDVNENTLAVEVKWLSFSGGRGPNGEFQRFIGQCTLAAARHKVVLGVCGVIGEGKKKLDQHEKKLSEKLQKIGVKILILAAH